MNKRFDFNLRVNEDEHKGLIFDNGQVMKTINVAYMLNEQHERIEDYNVALKTLQDLADKKIKENEQLKQRIKESYETERTVLGRSVLKQLAESLEIQL